MSDSRLRPAGAMRVLVTGGAGYVGSHIVLQLLAGGHEVSILDNFHNASPDVPDRIAAHGRRAIRHVARIDIRDTGACERLLEWLRPQVVVHLAGLKDVAESVRTPERYDEVNVGGTAALLAAMQRTGCGRLIFSSSAAVYGDPAYLPMDEAHPCLPTSPYGRSKLAAERLIGDWAAAGQGRSAVVLRYFNPVGCAFDPCSGLSLSGGGDALMNRIVAVARGQKAQLPIFGSDYDTPDGTCLRDFIHVADLAEAHVAALGLDLPGVPEINVGTGTATSVLELARLFQMHTGQPVPTTLAPRRAGDIAASCAAVDRAAAVLGWTARRGIAEMCQSVWFAQASGQNWIGTEYSTAK